MKVNSPRRLVGCLWFLSICLLNKIKVEAVQTEAAKAPANEQNDKKAQVPGPINLLSLSPEEKKKFKDSIDIIFLDSGGVLLNRFGVIDNAHEAVRELIKEGKTIRYITNSSIMSKAQIIERHRNAGFDSATEESVITPMGLVADYVRDKLPPGKSVYVVGSELLCEEVRRNDIHCFGPGEDEMNDHMIEDISKVELNLPENVGAVIVGFDVNINYLKILKAFRFLRNKECLYLVLSLSPRLFLKSPNEFPAGGALAAAISEASGREPFVLGKPGPLLIEMLNDIAKDPERALFVGDQLQTDILTGHKCHFRTLFVLSGLQKLDEIEKYAGSKDPEDRMCIPDFYANSVSDLVG